jgi:hypothetical protein
VGIGNAIIGCQFRHRATKLQADAEQVLSRLYGNNLLASWRNGYFYRRHRGLFGWLGWLFGWLFGWLLGWLFGWLLGWLLGWLFGWLLGWLFGWLLAAAIGRLSCLSRHQGRRRVYTGFPTCFRLLFFRHLRGCLSCWRSLFFLERPFTGN